MKLLVITQKVNRQDPVLGFFHNWVLEFAKKFEKITLIGLENGVYELPGNVQVYSLGKDKEANKAKYIFNFYKYIWQERANYDAVFVHMNQEYILLGGLFWKILGKGVYMWRNHHAGSLLTDLAASFCKHVFCTSKYSFTAKYSKTILMPVGVALDKFNIKDDVPRVKNSILFLGRISKTKNVHIFIEALQTLNLDQIDFVASIYGDALPQDQDYYDDLVRKVNGYGLQESIRFYRGIPNENTPQVYNAHEIYVNLSSSGMYDKTIFESTACGCLTLASNENLKGNIDSRLIIEDRTAQEVANKLRAILSLKDEEKKELILQNIEFVKGHSLEALATKLASIIKS